MEETRRGYEGVYKSRGKIVVDNFLGGTAWGLGVTIGVSIILAVFGIIFSRINLVPIVGEFASQITDFVLQNNPHLIK